MAYELRKQLREELLRWTCERHATNTPLDKTLLREKAIELAAKYKVNGMKFTDIWLSNFLKGYGFSPTLTSCDGPRFRDQRVWVDAIRRLIDEYELHNVFHVDELIMMTELRPEDTTSSNFEVGPKVTILLSCNASGTEKLPLLVCGAYDLQSGMNEGHAYRKNNDGTIANEHFRSWLECLNASASTKNRKILLLLSREKIRALSDIELENIAFVFFPNDYPTALKPLNTDVFGFVKMMYRQKYIETTRAGVVAAWNSKIILDILTESWSRVPREMIVHGFQQSRIRTDNSILFLEWDEWTEMQYPLAFREYVTFDDDLATQTCQLVTKTGPITRSWLREKDSAKLRMGTSIDFDSSHITVINDKSDEKTRLVDSTSGTGESEGLPRKKKKDREKISSTSDSSDELQITPTVPLLQIENKSKRMKANKRKNVSKVLKSSRDSNESKDKKQMTVIPSRSASHDDTQYSFDQKSMDSVIFDVTKSNVSVVTHQGEGNSIVNENKVTHETISRTASTP